MIAAETNRKLSYKIGAVAILRYRRSLGWSAKVGLAKSENTGGIMVAGVAGVPVLGRAATGRLGWVRREGPDRWGAIDDSRG